MHLKTLSAKIINIQQEIHKPNKNTILNPHSKFSISINSIQWKKSQQQSTIEHQQQNLQTKILQVDSGPSCTLGSPCWSPSPFPYWLYPRSRILLSQVEREEIAWSWDKLVRKKGNIIFFFIASNTWGDTRSREEERKWRERKRIRGWGYWERSLNNENNYFPFYVKLLENNRIKTNIKQNPMYTKLRIFTWKTL